MDETDAAKVPVGVLDTNKCGNLRRAAFFFSHAYFRYVVVRKLRPALGSDVDRSASVCRRCLPLLANVGIRSNRVDEMDAGKVPAGVLDKNKCENLRHAAFSFSCIFPRRIWEMELYDIFRKMTQQRLRVANTVPEPETRTSDQNHGLAEVVPGMDLTRSKLATTFL